MVPVTHTYVAICKYWNKTQGLKASQKKGSPHGERFDGQVGARAHLIYLMPWDTCSSMGRRGQVLCFVHALRPNSVLVNVLQLKKLVYFAYSVFPQSTITIFTTWKNDKTGTSMQLLLHMRDLEARLTHVHAARKSER